MEFELRNYLGKVQRIKLHNIYLTLIATCSSKLDQDHLKELEKHFLNLTQQGYQVVVIVHQNEELLQKSLKKNRFSFPILSDPKARIAKYHNRVIPLLGNVQRSSFLYNSNSEICSSTTYMSNIKAHFHFLYSNE